MNWAPSIMRKEERIPPGNATNTDHRRVLHRLSKYLNIEGFLEKSLKIKSAFKSTGKSLRNLEKSLNSTIFCRIKTLISIKLLCLYLVQHMLHQIKAKQFYTNFRVLMSPLSQSSISEVGF